VKNIFLKIKKYYFNLFVNKKHYKKQTYGLILNRKLAFSLIVPNSI